ncbi:MAG: glucosaminidase domain-containing protein [Chloroflexia bacterium]
MSRATASAYYVPDLDYERPARPMTTEQYRLLGFEQSSQTATTRYGALRPVPTVRDTGFYQVDQDEAPHAGYFISERGPARWRARLVGSRPFLAALAGTVVVALTILGAANALPVRGKTLVLSGYRDFNAPISAPGNAAAPEVAPPPLIDVTTAPPAPNTEPPPAPKQPGAYSVLGPPSLSVQQIEVVLKQYGSPAAGLGQRLFDLGVKYGIDPAYALAFFIHESGCGTKGVARFSKSLGNIRWTEGYGNYEGYRSYPNWETGMEDWYKLITDLYIGGWGLRTVDAIIPVYAPWGDNNHPPTYIASVKSLVDSWRGK